MTLVIPPNELTALIGRLRSISQLVTETSDRIGPQIKTAWPMPAKAVMIRRAGGPVYPDANMPIIYTRFDTFSYGTDGLTAANVWRVLHAAMAPQASGGPASFTYGSCRFYSIEAEAGPFTSQEDDTQWWRVFCPYIARWCAVPA